MNGNISFFAGIEILPVKLGGLGWQYNFSVVGEDDYALAILEELVNNSGGGVVFHFSSFPQWQGPQKGPFL